MTTVLPANTELPLAFQYTGDPATETPPITPNFLTAQEMERVGVLNDDLTFMPASENVGKVTSKHLRKRGQNRLPGWCQTLVNQAVDDTKELHSNTKEHYWSLIYDLVVKPSGERKFHDTFGITLKELTPTFIKNEVYNKPFPKTHMFRGEGRLMGNEGLVYAGHRNYSTCLKRIFLYLRIAGVTV